MMNSFLDLVIAMLLGAIVGVERRLNGHVAGIHTHSMVSLGAAIFVIIGTLHNYQDGTRIIGQVVTGIGFLCSGVIMREGFSIRGINTATSIWCAAGIGCIAAIHEIEMACGATALVVFTNQTFHLIEHRLPWLFRPTKEKMTSLSKKD